jgi:hypothetical protein
MLPYILAAVGGYLIGDSLKGKQYARGGMMEKGGLTTKMMSMLDSGFEFIIYTDLPRKFGQYHIAIKKENGDIVYVVKKGNVGDSKKVKSFSNEKDALDYLSSKFGVRVSRRLMID